MPNIKFSELPLATTVDGDDIFTLVEQPQLVNKIITYQTLASHLTASTPWWSIPSQQTSFVRLSGDTMTGYLTLNANPVNNLHAATKQYVDTFASTLDRVPIGMVMYFAASAAPTGWLACDGRILNTASFPDLFAVIGYTYGGSGVSFKLPDLRGEFLRGWDGSGVLAARGVDSNRVFGSSQADIIKGHTHKIPVDLPLAYGGGSTGYTQRGNLAYPPGAEFTLAQANSGTETRPRNVAMLPCIKYSSESQVSQIGLSAQQLINYITSLSSLIPAAKSVAKAWVNFSGVGSGVIRSSFNVISITKNGTGWYSIYFPSGVFTDPNYVVASSSRQYPDVQSYISGVAGISFPGMSDLNVAKTTLRCDVGIGGAFTLGDSDSVSFVFFGN
jgi:microcystin-dependent protein